MSESTLARFKSLEPPSEQRGAFNRFLAAASSRLDDVRGEQAAARRGDLRAVATVARREARIHAEVHDPHRTRPKFLEDLVPPEIRRDRLAGLHGRRPKTETVTPVLRPVKRGRAGAG